MIYAVAHWGREFENDRSRGLHRIAWVPLPNRFDSAAYWRMMEEPDAAVLFASWVWIIQVASRCSTRGVLVKDSGIAHDAMSLAERVRGRPEWFARALDYFLGNGWLCEVVADTGPAGQARFLQTPRTAGGRATLYASVASDSPSVGSGSRTTGDGSRTIENGSSLAGGSGPPSDNSGKPFEDKTYELPFGAQSEAGEGGPRGGGGSSGKKKKTQSLKDCVSKALTGATPGPAPEAVLAFAAGCAIPQAAAEAFVDYFTRRGWRDSYGRPVASWRGRLRLWAKDWEKRSARGTRPARALAATERHVPVPEAVSPEAEPAGPSCAIPVLVEGMRRAVAESRQRCPQEKGHHPNQGAERTPGNGVRLPEAPQPMTA